ncbi:MAG: HAMP domain-containing sensor histidine kinase [Eubacteriales bacterium]|nr:HAMP domain-containing sensor histidine kinase [Eubacteriales bacterium]
MTRKIFLFAFMLGASVLIICTAIFFAMQYTQTMDEAYAALQAEASYAASGLRVGGIEYLRSLDNTNRVTWIAQDGGVLYDSEYPELAESHASQKDFAEVQRAMETGAGQGIRKSSSGGTRTMYYAFLCEDGTILRLSRPLRSVYYAFRAVSPVLWAIVLVLAISASMALRIAQMIARPVNALNLDDLSQATVSVYPELHPLVERLREQRETIEREAIEKERFRREAFEQRAREREQQAQERERMRREFSANVSHELKTPLTSISGFAELMRSGLCDEEKMIEFADDIYRESQRLIALVNDIIRLSELDEGAVRSAMEKVDLTQSARNVIQTLLPVAQKREISLRLTEEPERPPHPMDGVAENPLHHANEAAENASRPAEKDADSPEHPAEGAAESASRSAEKDADNLELRAEGASENLFPARIQGEESALPERSRDVSGSDTPVPVVVFGSAHLIEEMIYNLCDNAVKYNREGGSVEIRVWEEGGQACLSVEDTGIGIPEEEQERVFERFYRVDKSHSRKIGGTGLGLSIVKHAAQFHGAVVEMDSRPGYGTKITLRFPRSDSGG